MLRADHIVPAGRFPSETNDCGVCALCNATNTPYHIAHQALESQGRNPRCGTTWSQMREGLRNLCLLTSYASHLNTPLRNFHTPKVGRWIIANTTHFFAVVNGKVINSGNWNIGGRSIIKVVIEVRENFVVYPPTEQTDIPSHLVRTRQKRRHAFNCDCTTHWLSTTLRNKILYKQQRRVCKICKSPVRCTGEVRVYK